MFGEDFPLSPQDCPSSCTGCGVPQIPLPVAMVLRTRRQRGSVNSTRIFRPVRRIVVQPIARIAIVAASRQLPPRHRNPLALMHLHAPRIPQKRQPKHILLLTRRQQHIILLTSQNTCCLSPVLLPSHLRIPNAYTLAMAFPREPKARQQNHRKLSS